MNYIFPAVGILFGVVVLWGLVMSAIRGLSSETSWYRTQGQVKSFKIVGFTPTCTYQYQVNGKVLDGKKIHPGVSSTMPDPRVPKSVYLDERRQLKFSPGQSVEVFYNPKNAADSALVTGIPLSIWTDFGIFLLIAGIISLGIYNADWMSAHLDLVVSLVFFLTGFFFFIWGISRFLWFLRSRKFPSTSGKVLKATAVYQSGSGDSSGDSSGGYVPEIEVQYVVDGVEYCATNLSSSPVQTLQSQAYVEGICNGLLAEPEVTVFYDSQAPWLGFLQHGRLFMACLTPVMGLVFMIIGACVFMNLRLD